MPQTDWKRLNKSFDVRRREREQAQQKTTVRKSSKNGSKGGNKDA